MKQIHDREKKQFEELFKQEGIDKFDDRFKILNTFLQTEQHITVSELIHILNEEGCHFSYGFVSDTLKLMCRFGFARKNHFDNAELRYEHLHLGQHHDHMVCTKCRKIIEFENSVLEELQRRICADHNFRLFQHKMELYGLCSTCIKDSDIFKSLISAKVGERLVIKDLVGGSNARMRLLAMGLRIGDVLEVITNDNCGQLVVSVDCKRYVLGRGIAQKIKVILANNEKTYNNDECHDNVK